MGSWAMAVRYCEVNPLLESISASAIRRSNALEEQFIINTAWACAGMGFMHQPFCDAIAAASRANLSEYQPHTLGNLARSFWVMRFSEREFTKDTVALLLSGRTGGPQRSAPSRGPP